MKEFITFEIENPDISDDNPDSQFAIAKIRAFSSGGNRHNMYCSEEVLKDTAPTIYNKPILYTINNSLQDFYTHVDPDKNLIAGFVIPNSATYERLPDSRLSLVVQARIWKMYSQKLIDIFKRDKSKKISVEMELYGTADRDDGLQNMLSFAYTGICVLSNLVQEASPNAQMELVSFAEENAKFKQAYELEFGKYDDEGIDFTIPDSVKNNAKHGLELSNKFNRGSVLAINHAKHLIDSNKTTPEKARHSARYMLKKGANKIDDEENATDYQINFLLWGGEEGLSWSKGLCEMMAEIDNKHLSYFSEIVTFPYSSLQDANPAIRGIDPSVTLAQANEIAKQADAIGGEYAWPTAIKSFKERHEVVDGKWVEKEEKKEVKNSVSDEEEKVNKEFAEEEKPKEDEPEEKKDEVAKDEDQEEKEEEKKEEMSLDANLDVKAALAFLEAETEEYKALAADFSEGGSQNFSKLAYALFCKGMAVQEMCNRMSAEKEEFATKFAEADEKAKAYMAENEELKKFKADKEQEEFNFAVNTLLKDIENKVEIPENELHSIREKSKEFTLATFSEYSNIAKASAFGYPLKGLKSDDINRYALPFVGNKEKKTGLLW